MNNSSQGTNPRHLADMIWYLTFNFGRDNPESFISEEAIIDEDMIWNCSACELVYKIDENPHERAPWKRFTRLHVYLDLETLSARVYCGGRGYDQGELVFHYCSRDDMLPESEMENGAWEQRLREEYERKIQRTGLLTTPV